MDLATSTSSWSFSDRQSFTEKFSAEMQSAFAICTEATASSIIAPSSSVARKCHGRNIITAETRSGTAVQLSRGPDLAQRAGEYAGSDTGVTL